MIYLDNAATTYPKPESVYEKMDWANRNLSFNAGRGSYTVAKEATHLIDETRELLINLVHGSGLEKAVLTSSATEALNIILQGIPWEKGDLVYISPFEHNAVARTLELVGNTKGIKVELLPLIEDTLEIDEDKSSYLFKKNKPKCVCCTHVSNVTGYVLPVENIFKEAHSVGAITVLDASQSLGLVDINVNIFNADFIAFAGHKTLYGPFGVGGFIDVNEITLDSFLAGGTGSDSLNLNMPLKSPDRYEAASKNIIAIVGLNEAIKQINVTKNFMHEKELLNYCLIKLNRIPGIVIYLPNEIKDNYVSIISFNLKGYTSDEVGSILSEEYNIAVRTGYHCAPYIHSYLKNEQYFGTVRIGLSLFTTKEEIDSLCDALAEIS